MLFMKRKIVQHGSSSLTITLPKNWVDKFALKKGSELNVEELGTSIIISTDNNHAIEKRTLFADTDGFYDKNDLSHLYQLGYDEVEIHFSGTEMLQDIKSRAENCIGFEIIDMKPDRVYIKSIATTLDSEFDTLLRKSFQIINEMGKELLSAIESKDFSKLEEIRKMETLNNRFTDVCLRILNKKGYSNPKRNMQIFEIVKTVERIADEFKYLCDAIKNSKSLDSKIEARIKETYEFYLSFYTLFYKLDPKLKQKIYAERKVLLKKLVDEIKNSKGNNSLILHYLFSIVQRTYDGFGTYLTLAL